MRIFIYSYPSLHINRGGPTYKTAMVFELMQKLGADVHLFDMWDATQKLSSSDLFYVFTANIGTYPLTVNLEAAGIRYVVNPIFYSNHSPSLIRLYRNLEKPFKSFFPRTQSDYDLTERVCQGAELILPNTWAEQELLQKALHLKNKKFQVIPNGVEKRFADASPELFHKKFGLKDFVLYVGHLGPVRKNGLNIIKALQQIDVPCVVIADILKNREGELCRQEMEKSSNIHYLGWVDHNDPLLASAYAACHTFVLPTRYETPGRAALEAGLAGANIVITPKGGTREYFSEYALYPEPLQIDSIVKTIRKSLDTAKNPLLRERILQKYTWETVVADTLDILKTLYE
ncbi:MAG: glycosyltransferase family 4 protein [Candidatus Cloacimonetes bacterium]|nr:glycosyltransferase family 4 protein [Candidatus Cloacimonadota bacterium]